MWKRLLWIFVLAFFLNFLWEEAHAVLYVHYKGGAITHFILLRAALVDAVIITVLLFPFLTIDFFKRRFWIFVVVALGLAVGLETWALEVGRWAYTDAMPIIPLIETGLTPTIQLAVLGYISFRTSTMIITDR